MTTEEYINLLLGEGRSLDSWHENMPEVGNYRAHIIEGPNAGEAGTWKANGVGFIRLNGIGFLHIDDTHDIITLNRIS